MFVAKVYKIAVISLSGIMEEIYISQEVIRNWNLEHAEHTGKLFLPVGEESATNDADVVIGIVSNYIEKADVIEEALKAGKKMLLFFSKFKDPENTIPAEGEAVETFKKEMESKCICCAFGGKADFEESVIDSIGCIVR